MKIFEASLVYKLIEEKALVSATSPEEIAQIMESDFLARPHQESFFLLLMNRKFKVMQKHLHTIGTSNTSLVSIAALMKVVLISGCEAFVICHNHPSGNPTPSNADIEVTRGIKQAAQILDLEFVDHVICGDKTEDPEKRGYYSLREAGIL